MTNSSTLHGDSFRKLTTVVIVIAKSADLKLIENSNTVGRGEDVLGC